MYNVIIKKRAEKFISKSEKNLKVLIKTFLDNIADNPIIGEKLKGDKKDFYAYHFKYNKKEYRIAYIVDDTKFEIYVVLIGTRENFYKELDRVI
jgi:mRNA-degrading endonuclease RelE of RelBE toxin-antitoxin system